MRALTPLQARVIDSLLAGEPGRERERIRISRMAPRTYQASRRRALDAGWVAERLIPDPVLFSRRRLSVALASTAPGANATAADQWQRLDGGVLVWRTPSRLFGVFSGADTGRPTPISRELADRERYSKVLELELDLESPTLPIYFDFEAEWARVAGIPGTTFYPRPLPRRPRGSARWRTTIPARWRRTVQHLALPQVAGAVPGPGGLFSGLGGRTARARVLRQGWMDRRAFLDPPQLPAYEQWQLKEVVFVQGRLREGRRPEVLLHTLFVACEIHPFLFATDGNQLLFACLSPVPHDAGRPKRRISVSGTLDRYLEQIETARMAASELETLVNHRYERFAPISKEEAAAS